MDEIAIAEFPRKVGSEQLCAWSDFGCNDKQIFPVSGRGLYEI